MIIFTRAENEGAVQGALQRALPKAPVCLSVLTSYVPAMRVMAAIDTQN